MASYLRYLIRHLANFCGGHKAVIVFRKVLHIQLWAIIFWYQIYATLLKLFVQLFYKINDLFFCESNWINQKTGLGK